MRRKTEPRFQLSALRRRSPERAVGGEGESRVHVGSRFPVEVLEGREVAGDIHLENGSVVVRAAERGRAVEVAIGQLDERRGRRGPSVPLKVCRVVILPAESTSKTVPKPPAPPPDVVP